MYRILFLPKTRFKSTNMFRLSLIERLNKNISEYVNNIVYYGENHNIHFLSKYSIEY